MMDFLQTWNLSLGESKEDIGGENPPPPLNQNSILGKKEGGGHPRLGENSTISDLAQTFRVT